MPNDLMIPPEYTEIAAKIEQHLATHGSATIAELHVACGSGTEKVSYTSALNTLGLMSSAKKIRLEKDNRVSLWKR